jgi:hypothetical protein
VDLCSVLEELVESEERKMILETFTVGLMLYTWHATQVTEIPELQTSNNTPGIYVRNDDFMVAVYRNSWGRNSLLGAFNFKAGPFDFMVGAATGYQYQTVDIPCSPTLYREHGREVPLWLPSYGCTGTKGSTGAVLKPMVAVSYAPPIAILGLTPRVSFTGSALNVSIEHSFK